jgi:hypothetical protein
VPAAACFDSQRALFDGCSITVTMQPFKPRLQLQLHDTDKQLKRDCKLSIFTTMWTDAWDGVITCRFYSSFTITHVQRLLTCPESIHHGGAVIKAKPVDAPQGQRLPIQPDNLPI